MIDLYDRPTPNGRTITAPLGAPIRPHRPRPVNIGEGEPFAAGVLEIAPDDRFHVLEDRTATIAASASGGAVNRPSAMGEEDEPVLFGQTAADTQPCETTP